MRTRTAYCGTTFPKAPTWPTSRPRNCSGSPTKSTTGRRKTRGWARPADRLPTPLRLDRISDTGWSAPKRSLWIAFHLQPTTPRYWPWATPGHRRGNASCGRANTTTTRRWSSCRGRSRAIGNRVHSAPISARHGGRHRPDRQMTLSNVYLDSHLVTDMRRHLVPAPPLDPLSPADPSPH